MKQSYYNQFFEKGQQVIHFNLYKIGLPADDIVYTLIKVLEELDFSSLLARYSNLGRKGYNPIMLFAILLYANMRGIRSVDRIVELCQRDIGFLWLTKGEKPQRDVFYSFLNEKLTPHILEDLHYQFIRILKREGFVTLRSLFIDGTKIEANANRYTFVWRGSVNYHLANLIDTIENLYVQYNNFIQSNGYDQKYELPIEYMFFIEGIDKVKAVIKKNRERKSSDLDKISNNTIIEIDNMSPLNILKIQTNLSCIADAEKIPFIYGKGKKKSDLQRLYELMEDAGSRLLKYKEHFQTMGSDRNSYSKTDIEATFMRMKDDHMQNGQLKPAYNVQIAVENYFIIHTYISNDRTDYNTLIPVLEKHQKHFGFFPKEMTADSGYCSEQNLLYLRNKEVQSYIKLQEHEKMKTRAYKKDIGKYYNMEKVLSEDGTVHFVCNEGRILNYERSEYRNSKGYKRSFEVFACTDCTGCKQKEKCLYRYDATKHANKNKVMKINLLWEELKEKSNQNIQSNKGIFNRKIRSIQTEGHFGDIKENEGFRRFNHRSSEKVYKEFLFYALGRNLNKYHRFLNGEIKKYVEKEKSA